MMPRLNLDFASSGARADPLGFIFLVLAGIATWQLVDAYASARREGEFLEGRIEHLQRRVAGSPESAQRVPENTLREIRHANQVIDQIALPWDRLFQAVEAAANARVSLLGITPDPKSGTVEVTGEALDLAGMFDYVKKLERQGSLSQVYLLNHQVNDQDPQRPVRFTVTASWAPRASRT